jgi:hypothetical protein
MYDGSISAVLGFETACMFIEAGMPGEALPKEVDLKGGYLWK